MKERLVVLPSRVVYVSCNSETVTDGSVADPLTADNDDGGLSDGRRHVDDG